MTDTHTAAPASPRPPRGEGPDYPIVLNGDHAEFEAEWAGKDPKTRPDWPLPSFDARDWAEAFCKINPDCTVPEDVMVTWFANSLMRGFDEASAKLNGTLCELAAACEAMLALLMDGVLLNGPSSIVNEQRTKIFAMRALLNTGIDFGPRRDPFEAMNTLAASRPEPTP